MSANRVRSGPQNRTAGLIEIAVCGLKLGATGFGGIAGMVATLEHELVVRRKWINHQHFMDVLSASYLVPGPNAVEVVMHCGQQRGGRVGLVVAGICYILPAMLICLLFGSFYRAYSSLPQVQDFMFGLRPATTALVIGTVFRLANQPLIRTKRHTLLCLSVMLGSLAGLNEVLLMLGAGAINYVASKAKPNSPGNTARSLAPFLLQLPTVFSETKLFLIFLKIGAVLYGSGYVLFAYMEESLVRSNHWLTHQQLMDAIAVGQITPGPILSSATFAGYLIGGTSGGLIATVGIFLPSFFISFFLHKLLAYARKSQHVRDFLDGLSTASTAIIAVVGIHLVGSSVQQWQGALILAVCLALTLYSKKLNPAVTLLIGSLGGLLLR